MGGVGLSLFRSFSDAEAHGHRQRGQLDEALATPENRFLLDVHVSHFEVLLQSDVWQILNRIEVFASQINSLKKKCICYGVASDKLLLKLFIFYQVVTAQMPLFFEAVN